MSNQNYGSDDQSRGPQQSGQGNWPPSSPYPGSQQPQQPQQPPPLPNRGGPQPSSPYPGNPQWTGSSPGPYQSGQQPAAYPSSGQYVAGSGSQYPSGAQYPSGSAGQYPSGSAGQYPSGPGGQYPSGPAQPGYGYGQQPPVGGQPGYGAGGPPGGPNPPAPPSGKGGMGKWIAIAAVVLIVVIVAVWAFTQRGGGGSGQPTTPVTTAGTAAPSNPATSVPSAPATGSTEMDELVVGQCLQLVEVEGATPEADGSIAVTHQVVDCNLVGQFKLVVASVTNGPAECATDYVRYYQSGYLGSDFTNLSVCLAPVLDVGVCYMPDNIKEWVEVPCTDPSANFKVESELPGTDASTCSFPDAAFILPDPEPARVYCVTDPLA